MVREADKIVLPPADVRRFRSRAGAAGRRKAEDAAAAAESEGLNQVIDLALKGLARRRATKARKKRAARVKQLRTGPSKTFLELEGRAIIERLKEQRRNKRK